MNQEEPEQIQAPPPPPPPRPEGQGEPVAPAEPAKSETPAGGFFPGVRSVRQSGASLAAWLGLLAASLGLLVWLVWGAAGGSLAEQWQSIEGVWPRLQSLYREYVLGENPKPKAVARSRERPDSNADRLLKLQKALHERLIKLSGAMAARPKDQTLREEAGRSGLQLLKVAWAWYGLKETVRGEAALRQLEYTLGSLNRGKSPLAGRARVSKLSYRWVKSARGGRLLLVSGEVENAGDAPYSAVVLRGSLLDAKKTRLAYSYALAGRPLPKGTDDPSKAMAALLRPPAAGESIPKGGRMLFEICFPNPPRGGKSYSVNVLLAR